MEEKFVITPPEALKLPEFEIPFYDPSQPLGYRCSWAIIWTVAGEVEGTARSVHPNTWRIDNGSPDPEKMPDEMLKLEMEDILNRDMAVYSARAAKLYFTKPVTEGDVSNWRYDACDLITLTRMGPPVRTSPYNPPDLSIAGKVRLVG